jgi:hypothetical protein
MYPWQASNLGPLNLRMTSVTTAPSGLTILIVKNNISNERAFEQYESTTKVLRFFNEERKC